MRALLLSGLAAAFLFSSQAHAYTLQKPKNGGECVADGTPCNVFCNNGTLAGTMMWNGSVWTDGVKSDPDREVEARKICAANGKECQ